MVTIDKVASPTAEAATRQSRKRGGAVLNGSATLAFKTLVATEVVEDDLVNGIEIAPCSSDGVSTITTAQISTDQSESWSSLEKEESQDFATGFPKKELRYKPSLFLPKDVTSYECLQPYDSLNANSPSSSLSDDRSSDASSNPYNFHKRIDNLLKSLDDSPVAKPIFMLRFGSEQYELQDLLEEDMSDDQAALTCITEECDEQRIEQVAPLNISPELLLQSMISATHKRLCELELRSTDVPFLRNAYAANAIVTAPFMMFPEKSTVIVSRDGPVGNYTVSSRGPLAGGVLTHLFDVQGDIYGSIVKIKSFAFRDAIPSFLGHDPIPLDASTVRVRLNNWRRSNSRKKSEQYNSTSNFIVTTNKHLHDRPRRALLAAARGQPLSPPSATASSRGTRVYCTTQMLSFVRSSSAAAASSSSPRPSDSATELSDDEFSLFCDAELRAMMEITQDGENTSALFPSVSTESEIDFCSDDGLGDEIGALDEINTELRKELAIADILCDDILAASKFRKPPSTPISWDLRYEDEGTETTEEEDEGTIATIATDDQELESMLQSLSLSDHEDPHLPPPLPVLPGRMTNLRGSLYFPADRLAVRRRVRFAEYNDEFVFISDNPTSRSRGDTQQQSETPEWVNTLEDVYYLFEDFMDDLGYSCAQALERNRPRPSRNKKTKVSTVYYI